MKSSISDEKLIEKLKNLPQLPGSYIFKDKNGKVIYVGKAKNLRSRVGSYFKINIQSNTKTFALVNKINDLEFIEVDSEFEALILEAELIRKYKPHYNIVLKDDRSYIYIVMRNEILIIAGKKYHLPKIITARKNQIEKKDIYFGPFPNSTVVKNVVGTIRKVVPFRDCSIGKFTRYEKLKSPCLFGHLGLCIAPCTSENIVPKYKKNIGYAKKILLGGSSKLVSDLNKKMKRYSEAEEYEKAKEYRNLLTKFNYLDKSFRDASEYIDNPYLIEDINGKALEEIRNALNLSTVPKRIECYDVSNISGKEATSSMVVASLGRLDKEQYRRFRIRFKDTPDDFGMIYETLSRRFKTPKNGKTSDWPKPDLVVLDGGAPQVSACESVMKDFNLEIPFVGIAKKQETLVINQGSGFKNIYLPKDNEGLKLIIHLRDEAHRFAKKYHSLLRRKSLGV